MPHTATARRAIYSQSVTRMHQIRSAAVTTLGESHGRPEHTAGYQNKGCGFNSESYGQGDRNRAGTGHGAAKSESAQAPPQTREGTPRRADLLFIDSCQGGVANQNDQGQRPYRGGRKATLGNRLRQFKITLPFQVDFWRAQLIPK